jgi:signal transduction histidine kinase
MRLRTRVRLGVVVTVGTVACLGAFAAASLAAAQRARDRAALGFALQQANVDRSFVRDQYLLSGARRARVQWERRAAQLDELLEHAAARLDRPEDRELLEDIREEARRSKVLFRELVRLQEETGDAVPAADRAALRDQLWTALLVSQYAKASRVAVLTGEGAGGRLGPPGERRVVAVVFAVFAAALAVVTVNGILTLRVVKRRLLRLRDGAERIAAGQLDHRIAMTGDDELADLARAFDAMAARLAEHIHRLEATNRELEAFSYSVSHDLRAPLRHIAGYIGLLEEEAPALNGEARRALRVVSDAARKMGRLIDDLLAFSRLGRASLRTERVELGPLVEAVVAEARRDAGDREVLWDVGPLPAVAGDAAMLRQAFLNLVGNAVKFSRDRRPARIAVGAAPAGEGLVRCFVKDNGVGFDMKYAEKLFGVFQRLHGEREFEGNGVGLANVQRIVVRHGGRVWAEAKPDEGATFWVELPAAQPAAGAGSPVLAAAPPAPVAVPRAG